MQLLTPYATDLVASQGGTRWSVADGEPADEDVERYPAPGDPCARTGHRDCTPRFLAPAPPRSYRSRRQA